jgi:hypothetical protein
MYPPPPPHLLQEDCHFLAVLQRPVALLFCRLNGFVQVTIHNGRRALHADNEVLPADTHIQLPRTRSCHPNAPVR